MSIHDDANTIIDYALREVLPDAAVKQALENKKFGSGRLIMVAVGKASWQMAHTASEMLGDAISDGIIITKYGHVKGDIPGARCFEAGHPVPDQNSFAATKEAMNLVRDLRAEDTVLFLLSGGGSALFEAPLVSEEEMKNITEQLLSCGANIVEINTIRKRLSAVKGGKFAKLCAPAKVYSILLSDVLGDVPDMIASGPTVQDGSTCEEALAIVDKYHLRMNEQAMECLRTETPRDLSNTETVITGSVRNLCAAAGRECRKLGYEPIFLTDQLSCEAKEAGAFMGAIAKSHRDTEQNVAYIAGGETVVYLTGHGKGGRNQEFALAAAQEIDGMENAAVFGLGSDGTDGPTDAAGGYCDGETRRKLLKQGIEIPKVLADNNAYFALQKTDGLIMTGPTGTNVNDLYMLLIRKKGVS